MKAVEISKFGHPKVLRICEVPRPEVGDGDVLVRVRAIGLNFAEVFARLGYYPAIPKPPFIPGLEFSGIVEEVGRGVKGFRRRSRVVGFTRQKAYAEFVAVPASLLTQMPVGMSFEEGAAIGVAFLTAYHGLVTLGQIRKGERLLLHAAAGGVGTAVLQIARHLGVRVYATVGSDAKIQIARDLGAEVVINYSDQDFAEIIRRETDGQGVDVILDSVGGRVFRKGWKLLAPMGRYVLYGFSAVAGRKGVPKVKALIEAASVPHIYPPSLVSQNVSLMGFNLYFLFDRVDYLQETMAMLMSWYKKGLVRPVVGAVYPFEKIREAHTFLQSRQSVGKVVVTVGEGK
ncbi:MAG: zinc-binding dehydrogenase [Ignavibacteriales bacterium]|nr:zinc-binding dehydrogenase [Ignavibacteriales bacterium]